MGEFAAELALHFRTVTGSFQVFWFRFSRLQCLKSDASGLLREGNCTSTSIINDTVVVARA